MKLVIGKPNKKQEEFFKADARFIAYGGARGGGKSWAVRKKAELLALNYAGIRILILRRTYPELRENHIFPMIADLRGIAKYRESDHSITFPNGSRIIYGYMDSERDALQYQGQEYHIVFLDEATQFTEYQYSILTACIRSADDLPKRMYLTCNPGGVGHAWVKRLFIDRDYRGAEKAEDYVFIKASVYDNTALMGNDRGYVEMLENLPPGLREAWLMGDWDVLEGRYFTEFDRDIHVIPEKRYPQNWARYFAMDYGLDMLAGIWAVISPEGHMYVYREVYKSGLIISDAAKLILECTPTHENIIGWIAPPDLWNRRQDTGKSAAEIFGENGIPLVKASNDRVQGWLDLKEWLACKKNEFGDKEPGLRIQENCRNLIRCLPAVTHDDRNPNDVSTTPHEITHIVDALRYLVVGRPTPFAKEEYVEPDKPSYDLQTEDLLEYGRI